MNWKMVVDPLGNIYLSALMAAIPIIFLFWALAYKRMKGHWAALIAVGLAFVISLVGYGMPVQYSILSIINGCLFGLFPVCWIVITALFIYNMSVKTGQFEIIKNSLASISDDRRMQALLIAFSFGAFIEGAAGFGTPVAITAAMLIGLGFNPLYAAGVCLLANTAPVAFGAIGIPIVVGASVSGVNEMALSQLVGRTLPFLSLLVPFYLTILMAGWNKGLEAWPACFVSGASFAITQYLSSNYLGPLLPDILSSIASIICTVIFLKYWHPKESWRFPGEAASEGKAKLLYTGGQVFRAWAPFIILSLFVAAWGIKPVNQALNAMFNAIMQTIGFKGQLFPIAGLDKMVIDDLGKPKTAAFNFNFLSAAGTSILFAWFFSIPVMGASLKTAFEVAGNTLKQLKWPIFTISMILGFAYIMNFSGMAITLGYAFATTGMLFPFFAAFLGWLGVFMTGSDTSTNALFGKLQAVTAQKIGID
ncbi:MAG: lactate permease LctP family transporter, partial [Thermodesulfovibrionales bacterium]|nr:lactate permease LctP family transporter [Thermodesulfovibrionales bacterium]